ncbi:MAG: class flavin-dependent oxidoreductase [Frankiales bacterium]|jgi:alkanesulfonate monooxygenase SsuD/methylene tetrahydromethanopterin reductase-like flavin-dependent oxidoreductase (luciferase family)|nr:class flavin-dependent oxidoreductase [Frankiales bacterium]
MKRSIVFAVPDFLPLVGVAQEAEAAGFDRIWTTEDPGRDALVRALTLALSTRTIGIGTGIAYAFTRAPLALAATAADAAVASAGRFSLGLGAGTQGMRTRWYGVTEFDHAASRIEEYAEILRKAWAAERTFHHEGRFYSGSYGELNGARPEVPIWGSGINATMLRIAARSCDGVAVHPLGAHLRYLDDVVLPAMAEGAAAAGRPAQLALWRMTAIEEDGDRARDRARRSLAFYFSTPSYAAAADGTGWGPVAREIRDTYRARGSEWAELAALVPDEMVADFCLAGTPEEVLAQWGALEAEYAARGVSETVFQTVGAGAPGPDNIRNLRAIVAGLGRAAATGGSERADAQA